MTKPGSTGAVWAAAAADSGPLLSRLGVPVLTGTPGLGAFATGSTGAGDLGESSRNGASEVSLHTQHFARYGSTGSNLTDACSAGASVMMTSLGHVSASALGAAVAEGGSDGTVGVAAGGTETSTAGTVVTDWSGSEGSAEPASGGLSSVSVMTTCEKEEYANSCNSRSR